MWAGQAVKWPYAWSPKDGKLRRSWGLRYRRRLVPSPDNAGGHWLERKQCS